MTIRTHIEATSGTFYITFTCFEWLSLFQMTDGYDIVYRQFDQLKSEGHAIVGYVIMPNHVHCIIHFSEAKKSINARIGTLKRFMAYELIKRLKELSMEDILAQLAAGVNHTDRKKGKLHEVFEPSFDAKHCLSNAFIEQKLTYVHNNPCVGKWCLSSHPEAYLHSSASFYNLNKRGAYEVYHYLNLK